EPAGRGQDRPDGGSMVRSEPRELVVRAVPRLVDEPRVDDGRAGRLARVDERLLRGEQLAGGVERLADVDPLGLAGVVEVDAAACRLGRDLVEQPEALGG